MDIMNRFTVIAILTVALSGCGQNPLDLTITEENQDSIMEELEDAKLTVEEFELLATAQIRRGLVNGFFGGGAPSFIGKTLGEVIEQERTFRTEADTLEAEKDRLALEAKAEADALVAELRGALALTIFDKGFVPSDFRAGRRDDNVTIPAAYENTSGKDIRAFRGAVQFADLFGEEIYTMNLTISDPIAVGEKATWAGQIDYNEFRDDHQALHNKDLDDMNIVWRPASIIFADGTTIGEQGAQ